MQATRLTVSLICALFAGCGSDQATIWSTKSLSPNGQLTVSASTTQITGPGNNWVGTTVHLEQTKVARPVLVLSFSNESASPADVTAVKLHWLSNSQLDVTYKNGATIEFQAVKALGVVISTHKSAAP
jgi:hypothetical protein